MNLNQNGLESLTGRFHLKEIKKKVHENFEKSKYQIVSDRGDLFGSSKNIGVVEYESNVTDEGICDSGYYRKIKISLNLKNGIKKNLPQKIKIDYFCESNGMEQIIRKLDVESKNSFYDSWVKDNSLKEILESEKLFD